MGATMQEPQDAPAARIKSQKKRTRLPDGVIDHGEFQRRAWIFQRCAWIGFALILIACLLGLLGRGGPLSRQTVVLPGGTIDVPAISRWNAPDEIKVVFQSSPNDRHLILDSRFLESFSIDDINPQQNSVAFEGGRAHYIFPSDPSGESAVVLRVNTQKPWLRHFTIGIGEDGVDRSVFVFP